MFAAILLSGFIVMWLCNLMGQPAVRYGIPFPVPARGSMGVRGTNFPAVALLLSPLAGGNGTPVCLGISGIEWITRFVKTPGEMRKGNFIGLPLNVAFFSAVALIATAGTVAIWGEALTNPTDIIAKVDSLPLTPVAAIMFFAATLGINLVANFIPPAHDLANLMPSRINLRMGGLITSAFALVIGGFWVSTISQIGLFGFVNTLARLWPWSMGSSSPTTTW